MKAQELENILTERKLLKSPLQQLMDRSDHGIFTANSHGSYAEKQCNLINQHKEVTGYTAIILGDDKDLSYIGDGISSSLAVGDGKWIPAREVVLEKASKIESVQHAKLERLTNNRDNLLILKADQKYIEELGEEIAELKKQIEDGIDPDQLNFTWPENETEIPKEFTSLTSVIQFDYTTPERKCSWAEPLFIGLFPTKNSWEIPAHIFFGNWNSCPGPEIHVAMHRMWNRLYGSEILAITHDVIETKVSSPPSKKETAWTLSGQQNYYAEFDQSGLYSDRKNLACALLKAPYWYFWWD